MDFSKYTNSKMLSFPASHPQFEESYRAHLTEEARLYDLFKADALRELRLEDHPRAEQAFTYAWTEGHADGYPAIFAVLRNIADVLRD